MTRAELRQEAAEFFAAVLARLEAGQAEYGDTALVRPGVDLAEEIAEEALDLAGWGFFAYLRARALQSKIAALEAEHEKP